MTGRRVAAVAILLAWATLTAAPAHAGDVPAPTRTGPAEQTVDVTGKWQGQRTTIVQTVTFHADGTVSGNAGCNNLSGSYKVRKSSITIGPLATTLKLCDDATMYAEQMFLAKLQSATRAERECGALKLTGPDGVLALSTFRKPGDPVITCATGNARP